MVKLILLLIILYIIYTLFFKKKSLKDKEKKKNIKDNSEIMVECEKCGLFISLNDAIIKDGKYYCSKECAEL